MDVHYHFKEREYLRMMIEAGAFLVAEAKRHEPGSVLTLNVRAQDMGATDGVDWVVIVKPAKTE